MSEERAGLDARRDARADLMAAIDAGRATRYPWESYFDAIERQAVAASGISLPVSLLRSDWPPNEGLMPGNERFDALLQSVQAEGIREPLTINLAWLVIDGQHRLAVARHLGIKRVRVRVWTGTEYVA